MSQDENRSDATEDATRRNTMRLMEHWHAANDKVPSGVRTQSDLDAGAQIPLIAGQTDANVGASKMPQDENGSDATENAIHRNTMGPMEHWHAAKDNVPSGVRTQSGLDTGAQIQVIAGQTDANVGASNMPQDENRSDATEDAIHRNTMGLMEHWHAAKDKAPSGVRTQSDLDTGAQIQVIAGQTDANVGASKMRQDENRSDATEDAIHRNTMRLMEHWHAAKDKVPSGVRMPSDLGAGAKFQLIASQSNANVGASKKVPFLPGRLRDCVEAPRLDRDATDTIRKIIDLTSSIESTVERSQATHRANTTAFSQLTNTEHGKIPAMSTTEGGTITATSTAERGTIPATSTAKGGNILAMSTAGGSYTERLTAYPTSLYVLPNPPKIKNLGLTTQSTAARKRNPAAKIVPLTATEKTPFPSLPNNSGVPANPAFPTVSKKRLLLSQNEEPTRPKKRQATTDSKVSRALPQNHPPNSRKKTSPAKAKQRASILGEDASKPENRKPPFDPLRDPPPPITILPVDPADANAYPNILARAPLDRAAVLLGDDFAIARGTDPVASLIDPNFRPCSPENPPFPNLSEDPVPKSWIEAEEPYRMLYLMHKTGQRWRNIREEWFKLTGEWLEEALLLERLDKFRWNILQLQDGDAQRLIDAVHAVEAEFRDTKWELIADRLVEFGGGDYPIKFLQKKHKELDFEEVLAKGDELRAALEESAAQDVGKDTDADAGAVVDLRGYRAPAAKDDW